MHDSATVSIIILLSRVSVSVFCHLRTLLRSKPFVPFEEQTFCSSKGLWQTWRYVWSLPYCWTVGAKLETADFFKLLLFFFKCQKSHQTLRSITSKYSTVKSFHICLSWYIQSRRVQLSNNLIDRHYKHFQVAPTAPFLGVEHSEILPQKYSDSQIHCSVLTLRKKLL